MKKVTLADIGGYEVEKEEALKIITFLKNYEEFVKEGISLPKGLLLSGKPGVGKTLLATAIANESNANFVVYKNNGTNSIADLKEAFDKARKVQPSILFIDELDQIVATRYGEVIESQKLTLQYLLTEIDGLEESSGIIVIATVNDKKEVPFALLRSGRLEKNMSISEPNYDARVKICDLYLSKFECFKDISRKVLGRKTNGLTGADIHNLVNEVLLKCRVDNKKPTMGDFEKVIPTILYKDIRKQNESDILEFILAHEVGHFITTYTLKKEVPSISIEKYENSGGHIKIDSEKTSFIRQKEFENEITILLGGMAGEKYFLNDMTTGDSADIKSAYILIMRAIQSGMFGFDYYQNMEKESFRLMTFISDIKKQKLETLISSILKKGEEKALQLIKEYSWIYDKLKPALLKEGLLSSEDAAKILGL